ncbi:MAG: tRNA (adenosine(37)-N6)-threonylcarbamoyltransferase complex dimerization subunit type 1 TsaB [Planctomycetes bacterium]|nr:tRNA (adenosine(37)-N6)-threonylcarbamoyltransferase complex dimerization subunit type 1 TsaB [Planctomycetota bacterium]
MSGLVSIAIETSCRLGGLAVGCGGRLLAAERFDAAAGRAAQLLVRLDEMLAGSGLVPGDIREVYVSVGPGSFTGTRIGVTVARTMAQALPGLRCVAVSSPYAVAAGARAMSWRHLGVILDARRGLVHATLFTRRRDGAVLPARAMGVVSPEELLARTPRPLTLLGEGLGYHDLRAAGVTIPHPGRTDRPPHLPTVENVWWLGRRLARRGRFTPAEKLLPVYCRKPEALRLWEDRSAAAAAGGT